MKYLFLILSIGFTFTACNKQETSKVTTELEGTWLSSCASSGSSSAKNSIVVIGTDATISSSSYSGATCTTNIAETTVRYSFTTFGLTDDLTAVETDFVLSSVSMALKDASTVSSFNTNSTCGYTDWALNVSKDITGKICDGSTVSSAGRRIYSIYKMSSGTTSRLQLGTSSSGHDGTSNATRHNYLDSVIYTKQ